MRSEDKVSRMISGHANPRGSQFLQIATADTTEIFYGFKAVDDNAVLAILEDTRGNNLLTNMGSTLTAYQGEYYPGSFGRIKLTSGLAILYLGEPL